MKFSMFFYVYTVVFVFLCPRITKGAFVEILAHCATEAAGQLSKKEVLDREMSLIELGMNI